MARMSPSTRSRLSAYTDAVFAVIITIMVLQLRPPATPTLGALLPLWPTAVSYIVSYAFVAIIWINHHYLMGYIGVPSLRLVWLNLGHLFCVSLLPFATSWLADTDLARIPVVFYAALFVVTDGMYNLFEREILKSSTEFTKAEYRATRWRSLIALAVFAAAACLALVASWLGFVVICVALALHLRPDVNVRRRADANSRTDGP